MNREQAVQCIQSRFVTEWADRTPYALDDETLDPPEGLWAFLKITHLTGGAETIGGPGNKKFERLGLITIGLRGKPGLGRNQLDILATAAEAMFEGRSLCGGDITVYQVATRELGIIENGRWTAANTDIRFRYYEVK